MDRKKTTIILAATLFLIFSGLLGAQEEPVSTPDPKSLPATPAPNATASTDAPEQVYAPFARRVRVALKEPQIRISWEDVSGIAESYQVYRFTEEITDENFSQATLIAEVPKTESFYTDVPNKPGTYFYAILIKNKAGTLFNYLIPFRNKTVSGVLITKVSDESDQATLLSNINATLRGKAVEVSLLSSRNNRNATLYRSSTPIAKLADIKNAVKVGQASGGSLVWNDYPIPGIAYYYAAVDSDAAEAGVALVEFGANSLKNSIEIPIGKNADLPVVLPGPRAVRDFPLPDLRQLAGDDPLPPRVNRPLDPDLMHRIALLSKKPDTVHPQELPTPFILPSDRTTINNAQGNTRTLIEILQGDFQDKHYDLAFDKLGKLQGISLSSDLKTKALFYQAQCEAFLGKEREAFMDFLSVRDDLGEYAENWVQTLKNRL